MTKQLKYISLTLITLSITSFVGFGFYFWSYFDRPGPLHSAEVVLIEKGRPFSYISQKLEEKGLIKSPLLFQLHARIRSLTQKIRAGEFKIEAHSSPRQVLDALIKGPFVQHSFTVPEGLIVADVIGIVESAPFIHQETAPEIPEGRLLPETYHYTRDESSTALFNRMQKAMQIAIEETWEKRPKDCPLKNLNELLVLASIIEKETGLESERPQIAAVFLNRLKRGMKLQSDPTVIYGLGKASGTGIIKISKRDLAKPTPYNTYIIEGLPPTPICNPGLASLQAVIQPADTQDLFFVADGTGGHIFSKTYKEHAKHHKNWRKIREERNRK